MRITRICANMANDNANQSNLKSLLRRRIPACRLPVGRQGRQAPPAEKVKTQNFNLKLKS